jgi:dUTP pyrophosphatase
MRTKEGVEMPRRATIGSAGYDFFAPDTYELKPGEWTMIDTGVSLEGDEHVDTLLGRYETFDYLKWFIMLVPRSGLSNKCGFRIRNTVGIVDMDFRDTIKAMVTVDEPYTLQKNERFLQGIILPFGTFWGEIMPTEARNGGHGSTGRF